MDSSHVKNPKKKIIYVVGCGRSGTTLLGFALGNAARTLDLGEVLDFVRFRGRPNGFGTETENYEFWQSVLRGIEEEFGEVDFVRLASLQASVDNHTSVLPLTVLGSFFRRRDVADYRRFLNCLYDRIQMHDSFEFFVDSSKYPSRLLHLRKVYSDDRIRVIHIIRNPIELARAMRSTEQSTPRSFFQAMLYFFLINSFSLLATRGLGRTRCLRLHYEDLASEPEATLKQIGDTFSIDTVPAIESVREGEPLRRGHIFNGNRMRMQECVIFRRSSGLTAKRSWVERVVEGMARVAFGASTQSDRSRPART